MSPLIPQDPNQTGLSIPDTIDAPLTLCLTIQIPNDPTYIEHILGTLAELGSGWLFQSDPNHYAAQVAKTWQRALQTIRITEGACSTPMQLRACENGCGIEYSTDDGTTWICIDLTTCIGGVVDDRIIDLIDDGDLQRPGGQPGPSDPPPAGECTSYHVLMNANERWKIPSPMSTGDTIEISNIRGGWADGSLQWYCYDGKDYFLGACVNDNTYHAGDPLQSGNHMKLIGGINTTTPAYFDVLTKYTIPAGVADQEAWLQANDDPLYDNSGQIEFDVEICRTAEFCAVFDFTANNGGWERAVMDGTGWNATYVAGQGWHYTGSNSAHPFAIQKGIAASTVIASIQAFWTVNGTVYSDLGDGHSSDPYRPDYQHLLTNEAEVVIDNYTTTLYQMLAIDGYLDGYLTKLVIKGYGPFCEGWEPCP